NRTGTGPAAGSWSSVRAGAADRSALRVAAGDDRLDQPVVALAAPVQDRHPLVLRVHEHAEGVAGLLHPRDCVLLAHRLDCEALHLDDPPGAILPRALIRAALGIRCAARAPHG